MTIKLLSLLMFLFLIACQPTNTIPTTPMWQWQPAETGLPRQSITLAVAVDPLNPDRIWAGQYAPNSLMVSHDGGQSWLTQPVGLADNPIFDLLAQPVSENQVRLWAATRDGLLWSDDAGLSWLSVTDGLPQATVFSLATDEVGRLYAGLDNHGVYVSSITQATWHNLSLKSPLAEAAVLSLAVSADGQYIYAGTSAQGVFTSQDHGQQWQASEVVNYGGSVVSNPADPAMAVVASITDPLAYTDNGGQTWHYPATLPLQWDGVGSFLWLPDGTLGVGTSQGRFYRSLDGGVTWRKGGQGLPPRGGLLDLAVAHRADSSRQIIAATWNGLYSSLDEGEQWAKLNPTIGDPDPQALFNINGTVLLGTQAGLFRWQAEKEQWTAFSYDFPSRIGSIAAHVANPQTLYVGTGSDGLFGSHDNGTTWNQLASPDFGIPDLAIDPKNPDHLFLLAAWERVYESQDGGQSWVARWEGLGDVLETVSLAIDPREPFAYIGTEMGLFRGHSNEPWQPVASTLSDQSILSLLSVPQDSSSILYIGGTRGIYRSLNQAETVQGPADETPWGLGLEDISVTALLADPVHAERLYAGTAYRGLYQSVNGGETWQSIGLEQLTGQVIESLAWGPEGQLFVVATDSVWLGRPQ